LSATEALGFAAVELFNERATAAVEDFVLSDNDVPYVLEICRRLDGMPLALAGCGKTRRLEKIAQKSARNQKSGPVKSMGYLNAEGHGLLRKQHRPTFSATC